MARTSAERQADRVDRKIRKHMKKNDIGQSDGLEVNDSGEVVYNPSRDERYDPRVPPNTPTAG